MNTGKRQRYNLMKQPSLLLILAAALVLAAATASAQDGPVTGGRIVYGSLSDPAGLIPMVTSDSASTDVQTFIYSGLIDLDKNLNFKGDLAESWTISEDGLTIAFKLRKGVKWHDGKPYTSKDAMFSYKFMVDPNTPTPYAGNYKKIIKAEAPDDYTFIVHYKEPFARALLTWSLSQLPSHLLKLGEDPRKSPLYRNPIGTGPYRFKNWDPGSTLELTANPDYWEGRPNIDSVVFKVIPDLATQFLELKSGGIDQMGLTPIQYSRQTNDAKFTNSFRKYKYLASAYTYLGYNLKEPLFKDPQVRRALTHAIDKEEIVKGVQLGLGSPATGPYKPGTIWYNPKVPRFPYDPELAQKILAGLGWEDHDGDGWLDKDGKRFEFTIITNQGNTQRANAGVIIQHRLAKIGIKVELRIYEWTAFLEYFINPGKFQATILGWNIIPDPDLFNVWHSSLARPGGLNFISYKNPELDKLLEQGQNVLDPAKRKVIYDKAQVILANDQPYTWLYYPYALPVVHSRFMGIKPAPAGISYNFNRWWVPKDQQRYQLTP
jgi:peptide/nickel transport system substrate-binding protein